MHEILFFIGFVYSRKTAFSLKKPMMRSINYSPIATLSFHAIICAEVGWTVAVLLSHDCSREESPGSKGQGAR